MDRGQMSHESGSGNPEIQVMVLIKLLTHMNNV